MDLRDNIILLLTIILCIYEQESEKIIIMKYFMHYHRTNHSLSVKIPFKQSINTESTSYTDLSALRAFQAFHQLTVVSTAALPNS